MGSFCLSTDLISSWALVGFLINIIKANLFDSSIYLELGFISDKHDLIIGRHMMK